jgi:hypothetical protein
MIQITLTETRLTKNPNTKTTYIVESNKVEPITEKQHFLYFDSVKFFRRLGGSESITNSYTCSGYVGTKLVSTSPDKQTKVIREFKFESLPKKENTTEFKNLSLIGKFNNLRTRNLLTNEVIYMYNNYQPNKDSKNALHTELNNLNTL